MLHLATLKAQADAGSLGHLSARDRKRPRSHRGKRAVQALIQPATSVPQLEQQRMLQQQYAAAGLLQQLNNLYGMPGSVARELPCVSMSQGFVGVDHGFAGQAAQAGYAQSHHGLPASVDTPALHSGAELPGSRHESACKRAKLYSRGGSNEQGDAAVAEGVRMDAAEADSPPVSIAVRAAPEAQGASTEGERERGGQGEGGQEEGDGGGGRGGGGESQGRRWGVACVEDGGEVNIICTDK